MTFCSELRALAQDATTAMAAADALIQRHPGMVAQVDSVTNSPFLKRLLAKRRMRATTASRSTDSVPNEETMRQRTKREPVKASNVFLCCEKEFSPMEMKAHLMDVHKLTEFKGQRSMLMHLDCADSYSTKWEWKIGDVTFHQETVNPRQKGDAMGEDF